MRLSLIQYPSAIAQAAEALSEIDFRMGEARQHLARLEGNSEMVIAFEAVLKNDNQRRARRFEVLQSNATARLEHLRNDFAIAKLELQNTIAQRITGIESRELVCL